MTVKQSCKRSCEVRILSHLRKSVRIRAVIRSGFRADTLPVLERSQVDLCDKLCRAFCKLVTRNRAHVFGYTRQALVERDSAFTLNRLKVVVLHVGNGFRDILSVCGLQRLRQIRQVGVRRRVQVVARNLLRRTAHVLGRTPYDFLCGLGKPRRFAVTHVDDCLVEHAFRVLPGNLSVDIELIKNCGQRRGIAPARFKRIDDSLCSLGRNLVVRVTKRRAPCDLHRLVGRDSGQILGIVHKARNRIVC